MRRFPPPWTVEKIAGGLKVIDANGQSLAYVYSRETKDAADIAKVLTEDMHAASLATSPSCPNYSASNKASRLQTARCHPMTASVGRDIATCHTACNTSVLNAPTTSFRK